MAMKRINLSIALMLLLTAVPLSALAAEQTPGSKPPEPVQQKEQYEKSMEEHLRKIGKELDELKTKAAYMTEEARKEMSQHIEEVEMKQKLASRKLEEMRKESQKDWKKVADEMNAAMNELEAAYEKMKPHMKK
jgi:DNA anti-recombination protein RmuC